MAKDKPSKDDLLERAKQAFKLACDAESSQRDREHEDLMFQVSEYQWDEKSKKERKGRPMLTVNLLTQPLQLIQNQATNAQLGVEIHPVNEEASQELAEIRQGLYRRIERDSNAQMARLWALSRATICGRGWYRVNTQYDEDSSRGDQEIVIERIYNQGDVYIDPAAQAPDCADARWGMVVCWVPLDAFEDQFPKAKIPPTDSDFSSWRTSDPQWVTENENGKAVLVAEYFYKQYEGGRVKGVRVAKLSSHEVLEDQEWAGMYIPLIPVGGRELQPFDGDRRWEGVVRPARDGQKFTNYAASNLVEGMASETKAPWIGTAEQFEGYEDEWGQSNVRNFPYIRYRPHVTPEGTLVPPPARTPVDSSKMVLSLQALAQAKDFVQSTTAVFGPSLGEMPQEQTAQSGRAILALQQQSDAGTGHFLQNLARVSMRYEARVILDLLPKIYDRPGRITQVLGENDEPKMVMLGRPFVRGPEGMPGPPPPQAPPDSVKEYDLRKGKYAISVSVGKSYQTRLQEGQAEIGAVLEKQPALMPMIGDLYFKFRDFPGHKEISDRLAKMREMQFPGLGDDEEQGMTLQQAQMELQKMNQVIQEMGQRLQVAEMENKVDRAKQEATLVKAQMETESRKAIAELAAQVKIAIAQLQEQGKQIKVSTDVDEREKDRQHEADADMFEAEHETALAMISSPDPRGTRELEEPE